MLTDLSIGSLPAPAKGQVIHLDETITGFGVRVSQGGTKTFVLTYGKDRKRVTIGRYPLISLAKAREEAKRRLALVTINGQHPAIALDSLKELFLADVASRARARTHQGYKRLLDRHLTLTKGAGDVTARDLSSIFDKLHDTPQERSHLIAVAKMLFRYGQRSGHISNNPAVGFQVKPPKKRERILTPEELTKVWNACPDNAYGTTVRLLILTGQRLNEIKHIVLDDNMASIDGAYIKNHRDHTFPVGKMAQALLAKDRVWGGWSKSKKELDSASGVTGWVHHDLRRTLRSSWAKLRIGREIAEKYINYVSGAQDPVGLTHDKHDYLPEMEQAVLLWEQHLATALNRSGSQGR